jgi:hypothetical protein
MLPKRDWKVFGRAAPAAVASAARALARSWSSSSCALNTKSVCVGIDKAQEPLSILKLQSRQELIGRLQILALFKPVALIVIWATAKQLRALPLLVMLQAICERLTWRSLCSTDPVCHPPFDLTFQKADPIGGDRHGSGKSP